MHKNKIKYEIRHRLYYICRPICKQRDFLAKGMDLIWTDNSNIILFDFYFGKLLKFYVLIMFKYSGSYENKLY